MESEVTFVCFLLLSKAKVTKRCLIVTRAEMKILSQVVQHQTYRRICVKNIRRLQTVTIFGFTSSLRPALLTYRLAEIMFCLVVNNRHAYIYHCL